MCPPTGPVGVLPTTSSAQTSPKSADLPPAPVLWLSVQTPSPAGSDSRKGPPPTGCRVNGSRLGPQGAVGLTWGLLLRGLASATRVSAQSMLCFPRGWQREEVAVQESVVTAGSHFTPLCPGSPVVKCSGNSIFLRSQRAQTVGICGHSARTVQPLTWVTPGTKAIRTTLTWPTLFFRKKQKNKCTSWVGKDPLTTWHTHVSNKYAHTFKYAGGALRPGDPVSGHLSLPWGAALPLQRQLTSPGPGLPLHPSLRAGSLLDGTASPGGCGAMVRPPGDATAGSGQEQATSGPSQAPTGPASLRILNSVPCEPPPHGETAVMSSPPAGGRRGVLISGVLQG